MEQELTAHQAKGHAAANGLGKLVQRVARFVARQKHNYRVAIARSAANNFLLKLTAQYDSIYTVALGADSVQLGTVNSIGNGIAALIAVPVGWLADRFGFRRFYLLGSGLLVGVGLIYALAPSWHAIIAATILYTISVRLTSTGCSVICADSVENQDRATAQNLCATLASLLSMVAPLLAAPLVTRYGGLTVEGLRPLYYVRFLGYGLVFLFVAAQLREVRAAATMEPTLGLIGGFRQFLAGSNPLRRWLIISSLTALPTAMTLPFLQVFAHEVKGADQYVLGAMATATILARLVFGIPFGRLADRIGRKKVIYLLTPLWYASHLLLIFSLNPITLVLAGALWTFYFINSGITGAMALELVPVEQMGKWSGLRGLFQGLVTIPAPFLAGLIWREVGPQVVFLIPLAIDLFLRIPLLTTVPETLGMDSLRHDDGD